MDIHDRFIWEIFSGPEVVEHSEYGGCQAANSLVHIDCGGDVWPCSSWPQSLGSLLEADLEEIWSGPQRMGVRREIAAEPVGCRSCRDYALCLGACRGLGRSLNQVGGERDPACPGPR
nr:SPASM domain-containing protein [Desulfuromonadales bacterium]